jgi:APA family basic amino acid/polyamine antiporter
MLFGLFGWGMPDVISQPPGAGGLFNLPSVVLVTMCCLLLLRGARESATANAVMVLIKLGVLILFIAIAFTGFSSSNLVP